MLRTFKYLQNFIEVSLDFTCILSCVVVRVILFKIIIFCFMDTSNIVMYFYIFKIYIERIMLLVFSCDLTHYIFEIYPCL